jgi:hypothetical protein
LYSFLVCKPQKANAQLTAADSLWFSQIFTTPRYVNDSLYTGNWYINDTINSIQGLTNRLTENFKFGLQDFNHIDSMIVDATLYYDSARNTTYNTYPQVFPAQNPLTYFEFKLNGTLSQSYSYYLPDFDTTEQAKYAFLIIPGNGENESSSIIQGNGYHNTLCYVSESLRNKGDVFCYMKPNEDARAVYWQKNKLMHGILLDWLKNNLYRPYGVNYLTELIATIRALKQNYCKVFVLGLSEGGYSGLLASLNTNPTASIISGGYSVGFDTSAFSNSTLYNVFDSLVYHYHKDSIKSLIQSGPTQYLFTYGDFDFVNLMQEEHDSNRTQHYFNDSVYCQYYYNFTEHTFPPCLVIDSFLEKPLSKALLSFTMADIPTVDSVHALVSNCSANPFRFDLYRNDTLVWSRNNLAGDTLITLTVYGVYDIRNIWDINSDTTFCADSINYQLANIPANVAQVKHGESMSIYPNPASDQFTILFNHPQPERKKIEVYSVRGNKLREADTMLNSIVIPTSDLPSGMYVIKINSKGQTYYHKLIKQ